MFQPSSGRQPSAAESDALRETPGAAGLRIEQALAQASAPRHADRQQRLRVNIRHPTSCSFNESNRKNVSGHCLPSRLKPAHGTNHCDDEEV